MATYASATNPFVKSVSQTSNNGIDKHCKKQHSPGTAVPHNFVDNNSKPKEPPSIENPNVCDSTEPDPNILSEEIKQASLSLVEEVIRLELEEVARDNESIEAKELCHLKDEPENDKKRLLALTEENEEEEETEVDVEAPAPMEQDGRQHQHIELIKKLRLQLRDLEKYAFERGELERAPPSILVERQSVILETLRDRLSLNIGKNEIETLKLDKLKEQVDKEIEELLGPLMTKEYLLNQFRTQLTDLERYIAHLHGALGKMHDKRGCLCHVHGCSLPTPADKDSDHLSKSSNHLINDDALPKTSKLIRSLVTQLICSDLKIQESARKEQDFKRISCAEGKSFSSLGQKVGTSTKNQPSNDDAAWSLHIDKVILATDSLVNLFNLEPQHQRSTDKPLDDMVESVVRRQLIPALRDLLSYGLIDPDHLPRSTSYVSLLFDPYFLLSTFTCFPSSQKSNNNSSSLDVDKVHVWFVIEEYYRSRNETGFKTSSVKTLSQSFNLAPSISGPIKITSKQALLIAIEDIIETMSKCRPNGPESHFRTFVYNSLNRSKLSTWLRLIFNNKSITKKLYHSFSFVNQPDKMNTLLKTIEALNQFEFKLRADLESNEQFVSAF